MKRHGMSLGWWLRELGKAEALKLLGLSAPPADVPADQPSIEPGSTDPAS